MTQNELMKNNGIMDDIYQLIDDRIKMYKRHAYSDGLVDFLEVLIDDKELQSMDNYYKISSRILELYHELNAKISSPE